MTTTALVVCLHLLFVRIEKQKFTEGYLHCFEIPILFCYMSVCDPKRNSFDACNNILLLKSILE
jgi:hypothetical protein